MKRWVMMMRLDVSMRKLIISTLLIFGLIFLSSCENEETPIPTEVTPMSVFDAVNLITTEPKAYEKVEFMLHEGELMLSTLGNPFDYRYLHVQGVFVAPSGDTKKIPAFWYQDYEIVLNTNWTSPPSGISGAASTNPDEPQGLEMVNYIGDPHYRLRYLPTEAGLHTYYVEVYQEGAVVQALQGTFSVSEGTREYRGVISVEQTHKRNFVFEDGKTFIPVGQNLGWYTSSTRQTEDYRVWFSKMNENHANFARVWMATWGFALHWGTAHDDFTSRQNAAARLDKMIDLAAEHDIYIMLALLNHGQFSAVTNPQWANNPWNKAKGGPLDYPSQFFTSFEAKETYKQQLLYILGRYGYSTNLMAWELFNEVDWTDNFNSTAVYVWHTEMSDFIKEHDAYGRMVTTSYKQDTGGVYASSKIDFVNPHNYGYSNKSIMVHATPVINNLFNMYQKPVLYSEIGINWQSGTATGQVDPTGISLKQAQWTGIMGGGAGAAMNWWWDSWVHPRNLYYRFEGIGKFSAEMDMVGTTYNRLNVLSGVSVAGGQSAILGYRIDSRVYGYIYDTTWRYDQTNTLVKTVNVTIPLMSGSYQLRIFNTDTGEVIQTSSLISNGSVSFQVQVKDDIAFIILGGNS